MQKRCDLALKLALIVAAAVFAAVLSGIASVLALTTSVNAQVLSGEAITVNDQSFVIYISPGTNQIAADYGTGSLFVKNNSCEAFAAARVCLDNIEYYTSGRIYKARVRGISLAPSLSITREVSKTEFFTGEETTFSVTLTNKGGLAKNMTYEEIFPKEFEVTSVEGLLLQPNRAVWKGKLAEGESASFTYTVKAISEFDGSLVPSLSYSDGLRMRTIYGTKSALKVTPPVILSTLLGDSQIIIGEPDNITINVTNRLPENAIVTAEVLFDHGLVVTSKPYSAKTVVPLAFILNDEIQRVTNRTTNTTNLSNAWINLSKAWFFEFKGAKVGNSGITVRVSYRPKSSSIIKALPEKNERVIVSNKGVVVRNSLSDATIEANQRRKIKMMLQNLNPYATLKDAIVNISTDMVYIPNAYFGKMGRSEQVDLVDMYFYAPAVDKSTGFIILTNVTYFTEFGDDFSKLFKDTVTVVPRQDVTLTQTVSTTRVKPDDLIEVNVEVKNSRLTGLRNVYAFDNVSPGFTVIGKNLGIIEVGSKGTVKAYTYKLKAPHASMETVLYVNTTMRYSDKYNTDSYYNPGNYEFSAVTPVTVEPEALPLTVTRTIDDTEIYAGEIFGVKYVITNTASAKAAKNILLKLPFVYGLDLVDGEATIAVERLGPGESMALSNVEKRRAKFSGEVELQKVELEYENVYGDKFYLNGSSGTVTVKDNYVRGPVVIVDKAVPNSANNTDTFVTTLKVKNTGTEPAAVTVADEGKEFSIILQNNSEYVINKTSKYVVPGTVQLPQASATYSYNGAVLKTASKPVSILIIDNPVLSISKDAPSSVSNVEPYSVTLRIRSKAQKPVENVTVTDGEKSWAIAFIPAEGSANMTYQDTSQVIGLKQLATASVTYSYDGATFIVYSNSPLISVEEKMLVTVTKGVLPSEAAPGDKVKVVIEVKNLHTDKLDVLLTDNDKSFSTALFPGEGKNFTYDSIAGAVTGDVAAATYQFGDRQLTTLSNSPAFILKELKALKEIRETNKTGATGAAQKEEGENPETEKTGLFGGILRALLNVLTWKRGG
ncbi:hypothetical protein HYV83_05760 [Candidatus Woesearchaeota archaeon]|nr:hypothetical protein [Candidatus Woesearchaeota archaeon]